MTIKKKLNHKEIQIFTTHIKETVEYIYITTFCILKSDNKLKSIRNEGNLTLRLIIISIFPRTIYKYSNNLTKGSIFLILILFSSKRRSIICINSNYLIKWRYTLYFILISFEKLLGTFFLIKVKSL